MSIFPTKILLATDSSEKAELTLSTAVDLANSTNSQLHVVTVGPWNPDLSYASHEASLRWETYEQASEAIGKAVQQARDKQGRASGAGEGRGAGAPTGAAGARRARRGAGNQVGRREEGGGTVQEAHLRRGRKDEEIVRVAEEIGAGLIVMGSRGLGGVRRALMGSVSDSVVRHAHCPVIVVRPEKESSAEHEADFLT